MTTTRLHLSPDESAQILTAKIRARENFFFVRIGDGALECMAGKQGMTRDGEKYSVDLADELLHSWETLMAAPEPVYVGDWQSASFDEASEFSRYEKQYEDLLARGEWKFPSSRRIHFETLLLMRKSEELVDFYRAVKEDPRTKLFMGPDWNAAGARMLNAAHLSTPTVDLFGHIRRLTDELLRFPFEVLLFGAGMSGQIAAINCWEVFPNRTYICLGSALDPLFHTQTRSQQLTKADARELFKELL